MTPPAPPRGHAPSTLLAAGAAVLLAAGLRFGAAGGPLAPLAVALLVRAVDGAGSRRAAGHAAALAALGLTSVASLAIAPLTPLGYVVASVGLAVPFGLAGLVRHEVGRLAPRWAGVAFALAWLGVEAVLGSASPLGSWAMPVASLAYALVDTPFLPLAGPLGPAGLSLLVLALGTNLAGLPRRPWRAGLAAAALATAAVTTAAVAAAVATPSQRTGVARTLPIRIVQPALDPNEIAAARLDPATAREQAASLAAASRSPGRLVVWSEGTLPAPIDLPLRTGRPAALPTDVPVLFGAATRRDGATFNSALMWRSERLDLVADKRRLVPLTEAALTPGRPVPPYRWGEERIGVLICWEAAFPALARRAAAEGATVLVVLANDAYAPTGPVAGLHLRLARLRAAETGLPVIFASQAGPSAAIDGRGRVTARLPHGVRGVLDADVATAAGAPPPREPFAGIGPLWRLALRAPGSRRPHASRAPRGGEA